MCSRPLSSNVAHMKSLSGDAHKEPQSRKKTKANYLKPDASDLKSDIRAMLCNTADDLLTSAYNVLMPAAEKIIKTTSDAMQYDNVNFVSIMRFEFIVLFCLLFVCLSVYG